MLCSLGHAKDEKFRECTATTASVLRVTIDEKWETAKH